jgi:peptidoglycan lytic transglycosylase G
MIKQIIGLLVVLTFVAGMVVIVFFINLHSFAQKGVELPPDGLGYEIKAGATFTAVATDLAKLGVITSARDFKWLARLQKSTGSIKKGEYLFKGNVTPEGILETIVRGRVVQYRMTIPEGYNIYQVADVAEEAGLCTRDQFLKLVTDTELLKSLGIEAETAEGYLFPETYYFPAGQKPTAIVRSMIDTFKRNYSEDDAKRAAELGFTRHQVVTLASIIEKETGEPSERPTISAVFHTRLKTGMMLQTDPTVIYGIKNFNGNITRRDLQTPTPYNTYTKYGLPPGPIANPGKKALQAALYPEDSPYIYFVAKGDGTHYFSKTVGEHNRAVRKYQIDLPRQRRRQQGQ